MRVAPLRTRLADNTRIPKYPARMESRFANEAAYETGSGRGAHLRHSRTISLSIQRSLTGSISTNPSSINARNSGALTGDKRQSLSFNIPKRPPQGDGALKAKLIERVIGHY
jgi:hypothetical protein